MAEGIILTGPYLPAFGTDTCFYLVSVGAAAIRLGGPGGLLTVPEHRDRLYDAGPNAGLVTRPYRHMFIQVPKAAANPIYFTNDNNTAPVVGGPGGELQPGLIYKFENAGQHMLRAGMTGDYPTNAGTAFQFIAAAATNMLVWFND